MELGRRVWGVASAAPARARTEDSPAQPGASGFLPTLLNVALLCESVTAVTIGIFSAKLSSAECQLRILPNPLLLTSISRWSHFREQLRV